MPGIADNFLKELKSMKAAPGKTEGSNRVRVSSSMVSVRYRAGQLWKNAGIELLLIVLLFFSLRHILYTGSTSAEGRQIAAQSLALAQGNLILKTAPGTNTSGTSAKIAAADSVLLPLGFISLITGGGETILDLASIALALLALAGIYATGKELFSPETGIAAAAMMTVLPAFIVHAAGLYTLGFAFCYAAGALWLLARSRRAESRIALLGAGVLLSCAIHAEGLFCYLLVFLILFFIETRASRITIACTLGGFILSEAVLAVLFLVFTGAKPFGYIVSVFAASGVSPNTASGYAGLAALFEQLFTHPLVLPFSLLAVIAIGYTLRASKSNFPYQPLLLFCAAYFTLEFLPRSFSPLMTIPKDERMLAVMAPAFALLLGTFLAGLSNRASLRWILAAANILALPLLLFY
ncbi:MAG: glycosyltransferase family 39 protein [Spirochaetota bacterium]|jgi:4-amino-4-deoxy-L-arabinose transferase-like glycosyltransferase|nr:glycosyltransferase family 39 protein [Spirochaetota bacterium]